MLEKLPLPTVNNEQPRKNIAVNHIRHKTETAGLDDLRPDNESRDLNIQIIDDLAAVVSISEEWDELVLDSAGTIFQTYDWQYLWWKHFAASAACRPLVVLFIANNQLIGLAPFFVQTYSMTGINTFKQLKLIGSGLQTRKTKVLSLEREGPGDYLDIIARRGYEEIVGKSVAHFLKTRQSHWDEADFQNLPEDGILMRHVMAHLEAPGLDVVVEPSDVCPKIDLPKKLDDYLSRVDQRTRRSLRRSQRTYLESDEFRLEDYDSDKNIRSSMRELISLHQEHWHSSGYPGLFADKRFESMQIDLAEIFGQKKRLWFSILRHEGKPIAARLCFVFNGCVSDYLSGIERRRKDGGTTGHSGAGIALMISAIGRAIDSGYHTLDLLRGDESYKMGLASSAPHNYRVGIRPAVRQNRLRYAGYRLTSARFSFYSRLACEVEIFRIISREAGGMRALPGYAAHLRKRITKSGRTAPDRSSRAAEDDGRSSALHLSGAEAKAAKKHDRISTKTSAFVRKPKDTPEQTKFHKNDQKKA